MPFDFTTVQSVEFGVCIETDAGESFRLIPIVGEVQDALKEMVEETRGVILKVNALIDEFSPAEKYAPNERLRIALDSDMVAKHRSVYEAENIVFDANALATPAQIISYFAVLRDDKRNKLMAFRRAAQFKGILQKKLIRFSDDALRIVDDNVFKLDQDFDFLIYDNQVLIWRPSGFEFTADMDKYVAASASANLASISKRISCVKFDRLEQFVAGHKRAMRLVAAIKSRDDLELTSLKLLRSYCKGSEVLLEGDKQHVWPAEGHEMDFLLVLDRRRYPIKLIEKATEIYEAASRRRTQ
jgi:hypothetical protein